MPKNFSVSERYRELARTVRAAGFYCGEQPFSKRLTRLVCATSGGDWGLGGATIWVLKRREHWFIGTWLPECYRVPHEADCAEIVIALLHLDDTSINERVPSIIASRFALIACDVP